MAYTLTTLRDAVENNLVDSTNLIWSTGILDEAIKAALYELSRVYGEVLTLNGLDGALANTFEDQDAYVLIRGAVAYALTFRVVGRFEEATPEPTLVPSFAITAEKSMREFHAQLKLTDRRIKQESTDEPYSEWEWEESESF